MNNLSEMVGLHGKQSIASFAIRGTDSEGRKVVTPYLALKIDDSDWFPLEGIVREALRLEPDLLEAREL